jgi:hypothetical protein
VADDDPRARKALRDLLYGASDALDVERLSDLADGFSSYTTTTKTINKQAGARAGEIVLTSGRKEKVSSALERKKRMVDAEAAITLAKDSADILLAPEGNLVQNLFIEEGALAASAQFKDVIRRTLVDGPKQLRSVLPFGDILPELPFEHQVEPFVRKTAQEVKAQQLAEKLTHLAIRPPSNSKAEVLDREAAATAFVDSFRDLDPEQAALVLKELRENLPRYAPNVSKLNKKFLSTLLETARSNLDAGVQEVDDRFVQATARTLSAVAQRGAAALSDNDR